MSHPLTLDSLVLNQKQAPAFVCPANQPIDWVWRVEINSVCICFSLSFMRLVQSAGYTYHISVTFQAEIGQTFYQTNIVLASSLTFDFYRTWYVGTVHDMLKVHHILHHDSEFRFDIVRRLWGESDLNFSELSIELSLTWVEFDASLSLVGLSWGGGCGLRGAAPQLFWLSAVCTQYIALYNVQSYILFPF